MPEPIYGPSLPQTPIPMDFSSRIVTLFGKPMKLVLEGAKSCTWEQSFGILSAAVQYADQLTPPWGAQVLGLATKTSSCFNDVLEVEHWLEAQLISARQQLMQDIPEKHSPEHIHRNRNFKSLPPIPKLFGSDMNVDATQSKLLWSKKYSFATALVRYDHCLPDLCWSAELQQMDSTITFDQVPTVEEAQTWLELELINARNKIAAAIPPTYEEPAATEIIPDLLGMPLTWEKDSWVLKEVESLCDIRLMDAGAGTFVPRISLHKFEVAPLDNACHQLENVLGGLYEVIDVSMVQQKPGEVAKLFSKKSAWLPLPEKPIDLRKFLVRMKGPSRLIELCRCLTPDCWQIDDQQRCDTWLQVLQVCTHYAPIPE